MDMNTKQTCGPVENGLVFNLSGEGGTSFWCKFQRGVKWTGIIPNYLTTELTNVLKRNKRETVLTVLRSLVSSQSIFRLNAKDASVLKKTKQIYSLPLSNEKCADMILFDLVGVEGHKCDRIKRENKVSNIFIVSQGSTKGGRGRFQFKQTFKFSKF